MAHLGIELDEDYELLQLLSQGACFLCGDEFFLFQVLQVYASLRKHCEVSMVLVLFLQPLLLGQLNLHLNQRHARSGSLHHGRPE